MEYTKEVKKNKKCKSKFNIGDIVSFDNSNCAGEFKVTCVYYYKCDETISYWWYSDEKCDEEYLTLVSKWK